MIDKIWKMCVPELKIKNIYISCYTKTMLKNSQALDLLCCAFALSFWLYLNHLSFHFVH